MVVLDHEREALVEQIRELTDRADTEHLLNLLGRDCGPFAGATDALTDAKRRLERFDENARAQRFASRLQQFQENHQAQGVVENEIEKLKRDLSSCEPSPELQRKMQRLTQPGPLGWDAILEARQSGMSPFTAAERALLERRRQMQEQLSMLGARLDGHVVLQREILAEFPGLKSLSPAAIAALAGR